MTALPSPKGQYFKLDQRTSSLAKATEAYGNTSNIQPTNLSQKSFLSFQSFRMNSSLPHSSKKFRGTSSQRPGEFLQEITNSLPKISSGAVTSSQLSSQLAAVISKKTQNNTKYTDYDFEPSHANKKPTQSGFIAQSQRSILSHPNKSVPDIHAKLGLESSPGNHLISNRSPVQSIMSVSSPKKTIIIEEKLPLKRRALNSDIKEAYRAVIHSKEHGAFHALPLNSFEQQDPAASPQPRNKNKKISYIDHAKELEKKEREKEEERLADEIKARGVGDFHRKIALYNFIRGNYLVEPDNEIDFKPSAASHRKIVVPAKVKKEPKKDFLASFGQNMSMPSHYMNSRAHSRDSFEKSEMLNSRRIDEYRRLGEDNDGSSSKRAEAKEAKEDTVKMKESTMEDDLKKMQQLGNFLSARKPLSENEQLVFKLVKDGNEQDLGYLLAKNPELVKAEDNTKQTPLHWAVKRGYYNVVVCLCKYGADIHAADITDRKPIEMAERLKQAEILDYLKVVNKKRELENHRFN